MFGPAEYWKPAPSCENDWVVVAVEFRLVRSVTVGETGFAFVVSAASSGDPGPPLGHFVTACFFRSPPRYPISLGAKGGYQGIGLVVDFDP